MSTPVMDPREDRFSAEVRKAFQAQPRRPKPKKLDVDARLAELKLLGESDPHAALEGSIRLLGDQADASAAAARAWRTAAIWWLIAALMAVTTMIIGMLS